MAILAIPAGESNYPRQGKSPPRVIAVYAYGRWAARRYQSVRSTNSAPEAKSLPPCSLRALKRM